MFEGFGNQNTALVAIEDRDGAGAFKDIPRSDIVWTPSDF
jgi:hypothetical protein